MIKQFKQHLNLQDIRRPLILLLPYIIKHWKSYSGLLVFVFIEIAFTIVFAWFLGSIADASVQRNFEQLRWLVPLGVALTVLSLSSNFIHMYVETLASSLVKKDLEEHLLNHLLRLPAKTTNHLRSGEILTHFTQDIAGINGLIGSSLIHVIRLPLVFIAVFIYMAQIHWTLSILSIVTAPLAMLSGALFGILLRRNNRLIYDLVGNQNHLLNETFLGMNVIRSFTIEKLLFRKYTELNDRLYTLGLKNTRLRGLFRAGGEAAGSAAYLISLCLGAYFVSSDIISVGSMLSFVNLSNHLVAPLSGLAGLWAGFQSSITAVERLVKILDMPVESAELPDYIPTKPLPKSIEFQDVTFSYDGKKNVFEHFNLSIPAGKSVAIVGASGAGKSTLFNLLLGFHRPQSGEIYVDGCPIGELSPAQLRCSIALVPQETFLFSGSIRDNLLLARPGVTDAEMIRAAAYANIHEFILSLPDGYDTEIGELGIKLSGGQRQRIAIARAILKDAPILLLDEATSSLDSETEHLVKEALDQLMVGRTTIVVAHRLSTIHNADLIVVLDHGKIVQMGSHDELAAMRGAYRDLNRRQFVRRSVQR